MYYGDNSNDAQSSGYDESGKLTVGDVKLTLIPYYV